MNEDWRPFCWGDHPLLGQACIECPWRNSCIVETGFDSESKFNSAKQNGFDPTPCAICGHLLGQHLGYGPCEIDGCKCQKYTAPTKAGGPEPDRKGVRSQGCEKPRSNLAADQRDSRPAPAPQPASERSCDNCGNYEIDHMNMPGACKHCIECGGLQYRCWQPPPASGQQAQPRSCKTCGHDVDGTAANATCPRDDTICGPPRFHKWQPREGVR